MTLSTAITIVLSRVGLSTSVTALRTRAREYISLVLGETMPICPWWWLERTTTFNTVSGTRTYQPVSGNVTAWWSFVDDTNGRLLEIIGADEYDALDPEQDDSGTVEAVFPCGLDTATGYPNLALYRIPDAVISVRVRYRVDIAEFTSSQDGTDFLTLGVPRIVESVLIHGAAGLYLEDEGDETLSVREFERQNRSLELAKRQNFQMQGARRYPPRRGVGDDFYLRTDDTIVTAA